MRNKLVVLAGVFASLLIGSTASAQTLYAVESDTLKTYDPITLVEQSSIALLSGDSTGLRGMAMNSLTDTMYISSPIQLMTIDLSTAVTTSIDSFTSSSVRSLVIDGAGNLWGMGADEMLYTIDLVDASMTLENGSLGMSRPLVMFNPNDDLLYLIGRSSGNLAMVSFDPGTPNTLTPVTITPSVTSGNPVAGGVYDPINNRFLIQDSSSQTVYGIDPSGNSTAISTLGSNVFGWAFDAVTTSDVEDWDRF